MQSVINDKPKDFFDVVIIGAGLSGIGAACHLTKKMPNKTYVVLESRNNMGGTWDLFRYPGIRSDSDMHTLGYSFKPWRHKKSIADGSSILSYIQETAEEYDVQKKIRYGSQVKSVSWDSVKAIWSIKLSGLGHQPTTINCSYIYSCTGYYRYDEGYRPEFSNLESFSGQIIHPQHWPDNFNYDGKSVVVIGSGATAITLVPAMAKSAKHVTMLQRSPTYVISSPSIDKLAARLERFLPDRMA